MTFSEFFSNKLLEILSKESLSKNNQIFVVLGQTDILEKSNFNDNIVDAKTFHLNGNDTIFDKTWFANVFTKLNSEKQFHLLSYAQFSYLINYIDTSFFKERVVILRDNLRQLFPITKEEYLEESRDENIEKRPENIPIYQAEQIHIKDLYFYSVKTLNDDFKTIDIFQDDTELVVSENMKFETLDISSDPTALDYFLNTCIVKNDFEKKAIVKIYPKQPINSSIILNLKKINFL